MTVWIAWALALPAFTALSLAMERHQEQVFGRALASRATLAYRVGGIALLALSLAVCVASTWSGSIAVTAWLGLLTCAALVTGWMLAYVPRKLLQAAGAGLGLAAVGLLLQIGSR